jgi:hypothetical protein
MNTTQHVPDETIHRIVRGIWLVSPPDLEESGWRKIRFGAEIQAMANADIEESGSALTMMGDYLLRFLEFVKTGNISKRAADYRFNPQAALVDPEAIYAAMEDYETACITNCHRSMEHSVFLEQFRDHMARLAQRIVRSTLAYRQARFIDPSWKLDDGLSIPPFTGNPALTGILAAKRDLAENAKLGRVSLTPAASDDGPF